MTVVRPFCAADVESVLALDRASFRTPWSRADFEGELTNPLALYLVAELDGAVIAYAGSWIVFDECHVTNIAVSPEQRGKGVGTLLVQTLIDQAQTRGAQSFTLEVRPSNEAALALYRRFGFVKEGRRKRYYADTGEDALILWRRGGKYD